MAVASGPLGCKAEDEEPADDRPKAGETCTPDDMSEEGVCAEGLACESLASGDGYQCAVTATIHGRVFDAQSDEGIGGALVMALDPAGLPVSRIVTTDEAGNYALAVPVIRDDEGQPVADVVVTLAASAASYAPFPGGVRPPLPIDITAGYSAGDPEGTIENAATSIALLRLADDQVGVSVSGRIDSELALGTLVVASGEGWARYGVADRGGAFTVFDVLDGPATIRGYRRDLDLEVIERTIEGSDIDGVVMSPTGEGTATVNGSVEIVDSTAMQTSIVLIPSEIFDEVLERGPIPWGLRAPEPGQAPSVSGAWSIPGVPQGSYRVLAAFENDGIVRDPDTGIAGTEVLAIDVAPGQDLDLAQSFKCTGALAVLSPGADGIEVLSEPTPTFRFENDASEDGYTLWVFNALGGLVWMRDDIPTSPAAGTSMPMEIVYEGPPLEAGMIYQFRAQSWRDNAGGTAPISSTEDLRGAFQFEP